MNTDVTFSTRDFYSSAVLLAAGCTLQSVKKLIKDGFSVFVFQESPEFCKGLLDQHLAIQLEVKSWHLVNAIKSLKARLYQ